MPYITDLFRHHLRGLEQLWVAEHPIQYGTVKNLYVFPLKSGLGQEAALLWGSHKGLAGPVQVIGDGYQHHGTPSLRDRSFVILYTKRDKSSWKVLTLRDKKFAQKLSQLEFQMCPFNKLRLACERQTSQQVELNYQLFKQSEPITVSYFKKKQDYYPVENAGIDEFLKSLFADAEFEFRLCYVPTVGIENQRQPVNKVGLDLGQKVFSLKTSYDSFTDLVLPHGSAINATDAGLVSLVSIPDVLTLNAALKKTRALQYQDTQITSQGLRFNMAVEPNENVDPKLLRRAVIIAIVNVDSRGMPQSRDYFFTRFRDMCTAMQSAIPGAPIATKTPFELLGEDSPFLGHKIFNEVYQGHKNNEGLHDTAILAYLQQLADSTRSNRHYMGLQLTPLQPISDKTSEHDKWHFKITKNAHVEIYATY
jgi:hypothetical protein